MALIHHNIDLDVNSNCYKDAKDGYWTQNRSHNQKPSSNGFEVDSYESSELAGTVRAVALRLESSLRSAKKEHLSCGEVLLPPDLLNRVARDIIRMAETEPCGLRGCLILLNFESGSPLPPISPSASSHSASHSQNNSPPGTPTATGSSNNSNNNSPTQTMTFTFNHFNSSTGAAALSNGSLAAGSYRREIGKVRCDSQTVTTFELHLTLKEDLAPWYSRLPQILRNLTKGGTIVVSPAYTIAKKKLYRSH